ncbi:hypothetical protein [Flavobacterium pedocola]
MNKHYFNLFGLLGCKLNTALLILVFLTSFSLQAQVVFTNDLDEITSEICTGSNKKLAVSVTKGTCADFLGNVDATAFVWQVESAPNVWVGINEYPVTGVSYSIEKRINTNGNVITNILTVNTTTSTPEVSLKYRVLAQGSGGCAQATSLTESVAVKYYRWNGSLNNAWTETANWNCGKLPTSTSVVVIPAAANPAVISTTVQVKEIIVENGGELTVTTDHNLTVNGPVTVLGTGNFTLQNNANLLQGSYAGGNTGKIKVARNSSALVRLDYTLWGSPVVGQNLLNFSPLTLTNRFYTYNSDTNLYNTIDPATNDFQLAKGYLIRTPNNHPTTATVWNGIFAGTPNNGTIPVSLYNGGVGKKFNAIGNPYPSPIRMSSFVTTNIGKMTGTIYFWRKSNSTATEPGYCTWTSAGFVSNGEAQVFDPNGIIRTGQGFFVEMSNNETNIVFNNTMRIANNANQFFRNQQEKNEAEGILSGDKIKLNVDGGKGYRNQMLLGYFDNATNGVDFAIDGKELMETPLALTMTLDGEDYTIQGKNKFAHEDIVPLKFKTHTAGEFEISAESLEGVFAGNQQVFLKDNSVNKIHDLKMSKYRFVSDSGVFENRFELLFEKFEMKSRVQLDNVTVYKANNQLVITSDKKILDVKVFDVQGRLLKELKNLSSDQTNIPLQVDNQVLLIQIQTESGSLQSKKIVF